MHCLSKIKKLNSKGKKKIYDCEIWHGLLGRDVENRFSRESPKKPKIRIKIYATENLMSDGQLMEKYN